MVKIAIHPLGVSGQGQGATPRLTSHGPGLYYLVAMSIWLLIQRPQPISLALRKKSTDYIKRMLWGYTICRTEVCFSLISANSLPEHGQDQIPLIKGYK